MFPCYGYSLVPVNLFLHLLLERSAEIVLNYFISAIKHGLYYPASLHPLKESTDRTQFEPWITAQQGTFTFPSC